MSVRCKIGTGRLAATALVAMAWLTACPTGPRRSGTQVASPIATAAASQAASNPSPGHEGHPYDVVSEETLLTILAFRGGALAKAGHNHVIASHDVRGVIYVPADVARSSFELHVPLAQLTIDEPQLRAQEGPDFPPDVPDSAKEGTKRNMLSPALLNEAQFPEMTLVCERIETSASSQTLQAHVQVNLRGQSHSLIVPLRYETGQDRLVVTGDLPVRQSDLGLEPFSAMLGALQVQDEMRVRFHIVAHAAQIRGAPQR